MVRKGLTFMEHEIAACNIEHAFVEIIPGKKRKGSVYLLNIYSNPSQRKQKFKTLLRKACAVAGSHTLLACGDFNAMHPAWGYSKHTAKGRDLLQDATDLDFTLITDPAHPTRLGNSVSRDTTPDLTFVKNDEKGTTTWCNTGDDLGSDHAIVEVIIPGNDEKRKEYRWTDWVAFRDRLPSDDEGEIEDIEEWTAKIEARVKEATKMIEMEAEIPGVDNRLAHLIEAKQSILSKWKTQRLNRRLRKKVAELNRAIEDHYRVLCAQQWNEICNAADRQM